MVPTRICGIGAVVCAFAIQVSIAFGQQPEARPQPGTRLSLDEIRRQMFQVSAGRRLKPAAWRGGARIAVALSFDVDNATSDLAVGDLGSENLSRGEYG